MDNNSICLAIRLKRIEHGWSQDKLAEVADISRRQVSQIECGKVDMRVSTLEKIARALGERIELVPGRDLLESQKSA